MAEKLPTALGSVIRSRVTGMTLVHMRAGWSNFNQSVNHPTPNDPENWDVLYDNDPNGYVYMVSYSDWDGGCGLSVHRTEAGAQAAVLAQDADGVYYYDKVKLEA